MPASIWKDYFVSLGSVEEADYTIETGGTDIFSGHAVRRPDESTLRVRINDICADYLSHAVPSLNLLARKDGTAVTFQVRSGGVLVDTVQFVADWSHDYAHTSQAALAAPVNGRLSAAQAFIASVLSGAAQTVIVNFKNGTSQSVSVSAASSAEAQVISVPLGVFSNLASVTFNGVTYPVVPACARYALAYVNAFGGWDTLLMEGSTSQSDDYDRHTMEQEYDNGSRETRGTVEYANEVTRRWTLRTGWLTDAQAARMHHLLGSTTVMLYDISVPALIPVIVTDTTCEYKTYRGSGARMVQYTVSVQLAQDITRR